MLMTASMHMEDYTHGHGPSSSPATSPPPWLPVLAADRHHRHGLLYDFSPTAPSPPPPATAAPPQRHLRHAAPSSRRVAKRRPRPSRRLPTTYISADPASFRRMVHQVTGADDLPLPMPPPEVLCRPAPARAGDTGTLMLPTLDTSAFLVGTSGGPGRTTDALCDSSAALAAPAPALEMEAGAVGGGICFNSCGFPTLESWDALF